MDVGRQASSTRKPAIVSLTASTSHVPARGGMETVVAHLRYASACVFDDVARVDCSGGTARFRFRILPNFDRQSFNIRHWIVASNKLGSAQRFISIAQSGIGSTVCRSGSCDFRFIAEGEDGLKSMRVNWMRGSVQCPATKGCPRPNVASLIGVDVTICASNAGGNIQEAVQSLRLIAPRQSAAHLDSVTYSMGTLGSRRRLSPGSCASGVVYYRIKRGGDWSGVRYHYAAPHYFAVVEYTWLKR